MQSDAGEWLISAGATKNYKKLAQVKYFFKEKCGALEIRPEANGYMFSIEKNIIIKNTIDITDIYLNYQQAVPTSGVQ
jgi:hypothetical protein